VRVRWLDNNETKVTGAQGKGQGTAQFDTYRGGGGQIAVVDENDNPISPPTLAMSADWPPFELMLAAGYCNCKPHPDPESCRADLENKQYLFAVGHYTYEAVFERQ